MSERCPRCGSELMQPRVWQGVQMPSPACPNRCDMRDAMYAQIQQLIPQAPQRPTVQAPTLADAERMINTAFGED